MVVINITCFLVAFLACIIGKICGMGGGVIIKPVLDALGIMSVAAINFLSACTVCGMTLWSVGNSVVRRESQIDWKISSFLAVGAAVGGYGGKACFNAVAGLFSSADRAGAVQAVLLFIATLATLIYTLRKDRIASQQVSSPLPCILIGLFLGLLGSFLGIGGGPFNMAVLYYFFSMSTKIAAQNSLYIILISQIMGLLKTVFSGQIPAVPLGLLAGMVLFGILGSELGRILNRSLSECRTTLLFEGAMVLVMGISVYNFLKFML